jgi:PAS domain S-box-containing protein
MQPSKGDGPVDSGDLYAQAFMHSPVAIAITRNSDRAILEVNESYCRMIGFDRSDIIGRRSVDLGLWEDPAELEALVARLKADGRVSGAEVRYRRKDGSLLIGVTSYEYLEVGGESCTLALVEDATERWKLDRELRESEAHYKVLFDTMSNAVLEEDFSRVKRRLEEIKAEGAGDIGAYLEARPDELARCIGLVRIKRFNREFSRYLNLPEKDCVGPNAEPYIPEGTREVFRRELVALARGEPGIEIDFPNLIPGAAARHLRMRLAVVPGHEEDWSSVLLSFIDLTGEAEAQEALAELVRQKDVLMRELEHRVKNNLNIISSLLSLEAAQVDGSKERKILLDAQSRIRSISLIYELLSRSAQGAELSCRSYIESLAALLKETYTAERADVTLRTEVDDIAIDVKRGVSLGLVVTELLTNAFKYAFPGREGRVKVELRAVGDRIELRISDDGVGAPLGFDALSPSSLGLQLVGMLVEQMHGSLRITPSPGFRAEISIPAKP